MCPVAYIKWLKWVRSTYVVTTLKKRTHNIVHVFVYVCMCCGCGCTRTGMCEANCDSSCALVMAGVLQNSKGSRETSVSLAGYRNTFFSVPMHGMIFLFGSMSLPRYVEN